MKMKHPILTVLLVLAAVQLLAKPDRIHFNGQDLFLNGLNLAWDKFANDIGPNPDTPDLEHFENVFRKTRASGGNSMRLWLHTTGAHSPQWDGHKVVGPGEDTIADLRAILDLAWEFDIGMIPCLWSFDMLRVSNGSNVTDRAHAILTQEENRRSYVEKSLIPMVAALKDHPAIIAWEIFNEPEGMSEEHGWDFNRHVPMSDIQAFINVCAGAIHRTDPGALVSNGSWAFIASSDVGEGNFNYYTDERLIEAGGDPDGILDFYMVHYYDWAGTERSPFHYPASHWGLDKPLVVAEFYPDCENCGDEPHTSLMENGYAGALGWSWGDHSPEVLLEAMAEAFARNPEAIEVKRPGKPSVKLVSPVEGDRFAEGTLILLEAVADDPDSSVSLVTFLLDGESVGVDATAPYSLELSSLTPGHYSIMATVKDDQGERSRSEAVRVTIGLPVRSVYLEAEAADYAGVSLRMDNSASGGAFLDMQGNGSIQWVVPSVPADGRYTMRIGFNLAYDAPKTNLFSINGEAPFPVLFEQSIDRWMEKEIAITLHEGDNTVEVTPSWGWMFFDYISFPFMDMRETLVAGLEAEPLESGMALTVTGPPGIRYDLMVTHDLVTWTLVDSFIPEKTPATILDSHHYSNPNRLYRILPEEGD